MNRQACFLRAAGLVCALLCQAVSAQTGEPQNKGLDFRTYLSIQRGMPEGEVLAIAGRPDLAADQGFAPETTLVVKDRTYAAAPCGPGCLMKTYTYLPTSEEPYTTTITFVAGQVTEIQRNRKF
jgi:hypothetical protein